jgi:hypothetical protein
MASTLREVLRAFEEAEAPMHIGQIAQKLRLRQGALEGMIRYWVQRGRLREVNAPLASCSACEVSKHCKDCVFSMETLRYYELVSLP